MEFLDHEGCSQYDVFTSLLHERNMTVNVCHLLYYLEGGEYSAECAGSDTYQGCDVHG